MYTTNDIRESVSANISQDVARGRARTQETAQRMVLLALRQWEKAVSGVIAVPSAIALSTAAGALLLTSLCERAFELVETTAMDVGRRTGREFDAHGELRITAPGGDDRRPTA